jgi:hypothetical protein
MNGENQTGANNTGAAGQISQPQDSPQQGVQQIQPQGGDQPQQIQQVQIPEDLQGNAVTNDNGTFVPLAVTLDERKKRQELENKVKSLEEQVWLYQINPVQAPHDPANMQNQQPQGFQHNIQQPQQPTQPVNDPLGNMGDDEVINAGELRQVLKGMAGQQPQDQMNDRTWETVGEQMLSMVKPDFEQVIMGRFRERIQTDPVARQAIINAHPILRPFIAYRLGSNQTAQQAQAGAQGDLSATQGALNQDQVQRVMANSAKPMPTSEVVGSQAFSQANRFMNMSEDEFESEINRVKMGG